MPQNGLNIGKDYRFDFYTAQGNIVLPTLLKFTAKKVNQKMTIKPITGAPIQLVFEDGGWEGSFEVSRMDSSLDDYFAAREAAYYAGANIPAGYIQETISEVDGSISTYQFQGVVLLYEDAGDIEAEKDVIQRVSFVASTRIKK
ncbi:MAG: hypothetical protein ACYC0Z_13095 [Acidobacteriaceae bacterium]